MALKQGFSECLSILPVSYNSNDDGNSFAYHPGDGPPAGGRRFETQSLFPPPNNARTLTGACGEHGFLY